ncbi:hypothetical protein NDU88_010906 [Pleurodeles waltl]|uniref:Uncharacterized protein n=1 Tax=Pleurodeles waltl TaxID=8319 RepID=A0AAV7S2J7_PLEWA|nr:hypothetical protein NDU88_010906 [Pleurodeles waltl]
MIAVMAGAPAKPGRRHECDRVQGRASLRCWPRCALAHSRAPQLSRGAGMNVGECNVWLFPSLQYCELQDTAGVYGRSYAACTEAFCTHAIRNRGHHIVSEEAAQATLLAVPTLRVIKILQQSGYWFCFL